MRAILKWDAKKGENQWTKFPTNIDPKTHFGREYSHGRRKNVDKRTIPEQIREAIWVRPPTSPLTRDLSQKQRHLKSNQFTRELRPYLVIEPKAGKVPGIKEPAKLPTPSATSSRLGLIEYPNRAALYFAATMLSKKPTTDIKLLWLISTEAIKSRREIKQTWQLKWFVEGIWCWNH